MTALYPSPEKACCWGIFGIRQILLTSPREDPRVWQVLIVFQQQWQLGKFCIPSSLTLTNTNLTKNIKEEKSFILRCHGLNLHWDCDLPTITAFFEGKFIPSYIFLHPIDRSGHGWWCPNSSNPTSSCWWQMHNCPAIWAFSTNYEPLSQTANVKPMEAWKAYNLFPRQKLFQTNRAILQIWF